jgi:hypothetical protein
MYRTLLQAQFLTALTVEAANRPHFRHINLASMATAAASVGLAATPANDCWPIGELRLYS